MRGWNAKSWLSYIRLVWVESVMSMGVSAWSCDFGLICNIFFVLICGKSMWFCKLFRWIDIGSFDSFCVCASISFDGEIFFCLIYHSVWAVIYRLKCFFTLSFLTKTKFFEKRSLDMRVSSIVFLDAVKDRPLIVAFKFFTKVFTGWTSDVFIKKTILAKPIEFRILILLWCISNPLWWCILMLRELKINSCSNVLNCGVQRGGGL